MMMMMVTMMNKNKNKKKEKNEEEKKNVRQQVWQTVSLWKSEMNDWCVRCCYEECLPMTGSH